eukprot:2411013-Rhodomonas_salina.1
MRVPCPASSMSRECSAPIRCQTRRNQSRYKRFWYDLCQSLFDLGVLTSTCGTSFSDLPDWPVLVVGVVLQLAGSVPDIAWQARRQIAPDTLCQYWGLRSKHVGR